MAYLKLSELFMDEVQKGMGQFSAPDVERIKKVEKQARNTVYGERSKSKKSYKPRTKYCK